MQKLNSYWSIIILFALMTCLFNFRPLVGGRMEAIGAVFIPIGLFVLGAKTIYLRSFKYNISIFVLLLLAMFLMSPLVGAISRNQNPNPMVAAKFLPVSVFYVLLAYRFKVNDITKAVKWLIVIYALILAQAYFLAPNNILGYRDITNNDINSMINNRGVMRFAVPGADFVVMAIFLVLTKMEKGFKFYALLMLLFVLCFLRGTRVVFFSVILLSAIGFAFRYKSKLTIAFAAMVIGLSVFFTFETLKDSRSQDPLTRFVQSATHQLETRQDGTEDIRIMMGAFFFTKFNQNQTQVIIGNGIRGSKSEYDRMLNYYNINFGFWLEDSGFVMIYIYFGLVGVVLYLLLFVYIILLRLPRKYLWAKYFILNQFLILIANTGLLLSTGSLLFGIALYVVYRGQQAMHVLHVSSRELVRF